MGTVNYETSKYITLGLEPFDFSDYEDESGEIDYIARMNDMDEVWQDVERELSGCPSSYFRVSIAPGYYEGFSIDIDLSPLFPFLFCEDDLQFAFREVVQIGAILLRLVKMGLVQCLPGWCTKYASESESKKAIAVAVRKMKESLYNEIDHCEYDNIHHNWNRNNKN